MALESFRESEKRRGVLGGDVEKQMLQVERKVEKMQWLGSASREFHRISVKLRFQLCFQ